MFQAILSPFAAKSSKHDGMSDEEEDELENQLLALDADDNGEFGDEDLFAEDDDIDHDDEIDPGLQAQDTAIINAVVEEADLDGRLPPLSRSVRAASAMAITKV